MHTVTDEIQALEDDRRATDAELSQMLDRVRALLAEPIDRRDHLSIARHLDTAHHRARYLIRLDKWIAQEQGHAVRPSRCDRCGDPLAFRDAVAEIVVERLGFDKHVTVHAEPCLLPSDVLA